jgi:hypothetical protein
MPLIGLSLTSATRFDASTHLHQELRISSLRSKTGRVLSSQFVYPNFTHCVYVCHRFAVGLALLTTCSHAVIVECCKITYKNIHMQLV